MRVKERRELITKLVNERGYASIEFLAKHCDVSGQTIRRDIISLSESNLVSRYHGGAGPVSSVVNTSYDVRRISMVDVKERLTRRVLEMIPDKSSIFLSPGSTMEVMARQLSNLNHGLVITNSLHAVHHLSANPDLEVLVPGGKVRHSNGAIVGPMAMDFLHQFHADFMLMSLGAISQDGEMLDYDYNEATLFRAMMDSARRIIVVADKTKFDKTATVRVGNLSEISVLVTDAPPSPAINEILVQNRVELVVVDQDTPLTSLYEDD